MEISREEFTRWLEKKGFDICGISNTSRSCPLAKFLQEQENHKDLWVGLGEVTKYYPDKEREVTPLPPWASAFYHKLDASGKEYGKKYMISGFEGLDILKGIPDDPPNVDSTDPS